jgi:Sulfotransferase domain
VVTTPRAGEKHPAEQRRLRRIIELAFAKLPPAARRSVLHSFGKYAPWEEGFDPIPPQAQMGQIVGPPDFVGIGAQKAGTTWWFDAICAHPDVFCRADIHKERHFFGRYAVRSFGPADCSLYDGWFPRPPGSLTGEWTPDYMHYPWVPALLAQAAPRARLVMLRDPVERFRSGLAHQLRDRKKLNVETYRDAIGRGLYHDELRQWAAHFPQEQILVLQYEQCMADPSTHLARTYRFLGLEPFVHEGITKRVNATAGTPDLEENVRQRLVELYEPDVRALSRQFPNLDLSLWPNFSGVTVEEH